MPRQACDEIELELPRSGRGSTAGTLRLMAESEAWSVAIEYCMQPWRRFVQTGALGRSLIKLCVLAQPVVPLSFVLQRADENDIQMTFVMAGTSFDAAFRSGWDDDAKIAIEWLLALLNEHLPDEVTHRFSLERDTMTWNVRFAADESAASTLPTAEEIATVCFEEDPSYPTLLAGWIERLARFAGVEDVACDMPSLAARYRDTDSFALRLRTDYLTQTIDFRRDGDDFVVDRVFDALNHLLEDRRLVRYTSAKSKSPWGVAVALATEGEIASLRAAALLREPDQRNDTLDGFANAGLILPAYPRPAATLSRMRMLTDDAFDFDLRDGEVWLGHDERSRLVSLDNERGDEIRIVRALNELFAEGELTDRLVLMRGEPHWYGLRVLLLPMPWVAHVADWPQTEANCLPNEPRPASLPVLTHPTSRGVVRFARVPTVEDIVGEERVCEHDFKCSARPGDYQDLFDELAAFADLPVRADSVSWAGTDIEVRLDDGARIRCSNQKYADVSPMLDHLNAQLENVGPYRMYTFAGAGWEGGVLLADSDELETLQRARYC